MTRQGLLKQIQRKNEPLKRIAELEEENTELKEQLERAIELIKDYVDRDDSCWSIKKRAEEFLKEEL